MTAAADISWSGPAGTFNLRVAAVITRGDQVLVCTVDGLDCWFLPAGLIPVLPGPGEALRHVVLHRLDRAPAGLPHR
jgi:hypothetical protein